MSASNRRRVTRRWLGRCATAFVSASLAAPSALAQPTSAGAAAQLLFDEAKALVAKGDFARACPKFVESHKLDPGGGTVLHAADCHQREGKLATAITEYHEALSIAVRDKRRDREDYARSELEALERRVGKLALVVPIGVKSIEGLTISVGDIAVTRARWETPIPLDPGTHVVTLDAPGRQTVRAQAEVTNGNVTTLVLDSAPGPDATVAQVAGAASSSESDESADRGGAQRTIALAVGGVGVVGLLVGVGFGVHAMSVGDQSGQCTLGPNANGCPPSAVDDQDTARTSATISTIGFAAGGALLAGAAVLWFTAPKTSRSVGLAAAPIAGGGGVLLKGGF